MSRVGRRGHGGKHATRASAVGWSNLWGSVTIMFCGKEKSRVPGFLSCHHAFPVPFIASLSPKQVIITPAWHWQVTFISPPKSSSWQPFRSDNASDSFSGLCRKEKGLHKLFKRVCCSKRRHQVEREAEGVAPDFCSQTQSLCGPRKLSWLRGSSLFLLHLDPIVFSLTKQKGVCKIIVKKILFNESGAWVWKSQLFYVEVVRFGQIGTLLTAHGLNFLICKMGIILISTWKDCYEDWMNECLARWRAWKTTQILAVVFILC